MWIPSILDNFDSSVNCNVDTHSLILRLFSFEHRYNTVEDLRRVEKPVLLRVSLVFLKVLPVQEKLSRIKDYYGSQ